MKTSRAGVASSTQTVRQKYERMQGSEDHPEGETKESDDTMMEAAVAAGAVAGSAQQRDAGPSFKDQVNDVPVGRLEDSTKRAGASAAAGAVAGSATERDAGPNFKDQVHDVPQSGARLDYNARSGAATVPGATAGSAQQRDQGPNFKDQVREVPEGGRTFESDMDEESANLPASQSIQNPDYTDVLEAPDENAAEDRRVANAESNNLIEAELVKDPHSAIHVAVEVEEQPTRSHWKTIALIVVGMLVLIGAVVGGVVGSQSRNSSSSTDRVVVVTTAPTAAPPPVLTACDNATLLELGNIVNATIGLNTTTLENVPTCGTAVSVPGAAGVWLKFEKGEDDTAAGVSISTCTGDPSLDGDFDSQLLVFTGSCDRLICEQGNDNLQQQGCATEAGVAFIANPSTVYYIFVYGRQPGATGDFSVQAIGARVSPPNNECNRAKVIHDREQVNATLLDADPPPFTVIDCDGTLDYGAPGVWFLIDIFETRTRVEDDEELIITTCSPVDTMGLRISVFLGSCGGLLCNPMPLTRVADVGEESLDCKGISDSVRFNPQARSTYFVLVQSAANNGIREFAILARSSTFALKPNDECENATPLEFGFVEAGSTVFATASVNPPSVCGTAFDAFNSPDLWYSVISSSSNNPVLTATTCTGDATLDASSFDNQLVVYEGDCNNLTCIGGNDDFNFENGSCPFKGQVTWSARESVTYYIRVFGHGEGSVGTFGIKVEMEGPPPNDICEDAILLQPGIVVASSTVGATADPGSSCSSSSPVNPIGVWFQVLGNDEQYTVSTCSGNLNLDFSGFASQISVFSGSSCSDLLCVGVNDGNMGALNAFGIVSCNSGVSWFASIGESYWVSVIGTNTTGPFPIAVHPTPENDMCESAAVLELNAVVEGTTLGGRLGPEPTVCDAEGSSAIPRDDLPGAWYVFVGTGDMLTLSTCTGNSTLDDNGYDSQIAVYSGDCSSLLCIAGNDDNSQDECFGNNAGVSWLSNAGEVYFAKVYGYSTVGTFGLTLSEGGSTEPPITPTPTSAPLTLPPASTNDVCENAIEIISGLLAPGTTEGATN